MLLVLVDTRKCVVLPLTRAISHTTGSCVIFHGLHTGSSTGYASENHGQPMELPWVTHRGHLIKHPSRAVP